MDVEIEEETKLFQAIETVIDLNKSHSNEVSYVISIVREMIMDSFPRIVNGKKKENFLYSWERFWEKHGC